MATAEPATVIDRTGWHEGVFATPGWTLGAADETHYFVGQLSGGGLLRESGSLTGWQENVGALCRGNPMAIFCVGVALAAPLLHPAGMENCSGQLVPDTVLSFSSASAGAIPPLKACGRTVL